MVVFRKLCYFTIIFTISTALFRIAYHFFMRKSWKNSGEDMCYAEFMYLRTLLPIWKYRIKRSKYYESKRYTIRIIVTNIFYIALGLALLFIIIMIDRSKYGVWLDIAI